MDEVRVYWSPIKTVALASIFVLVALLMVVEAPVTAERRPFFPVWLTYLGAGCMILLVLLLFASFFRTAGRAVAVLTKEGIVFWLYSETLIPWSKVTKVRRSIEPFRNKVVGVRFDIDPEFAESVKRDWFQRLRVKMGGSRSFFVVGTWTMDTNADLLSIYAEMMMHPGRAANV